MLNRRTLLSAAAATSALVAGKRARAMTDPKSMENSATKKQTFVLVHGAWHGGWCWRLVADALRAQGHIVYTPTLTGMGEREHLGTAQTGLTTHIEDVLAVLKYEELSDIVLVGHSYGGPVCQGVYDAAADNISKLIMLDAVVRENGTSMTSTAPPELIEKTEATLIDGYKLPAWPPEAFAVLAEDGDVYAWLKRRLTTMPYGSLSQPLELKNPTPTGPDVLYIQCTGRRYSGDSSISAGQAKALGWTLQTIDTGHDAMVTAPQELTAMLLAAV